MSRINEIHMFFLTGLASVMLTFDQYKWSDIYIYIYIYIAFEFSFELLSKSWDYKHLLWKSRFNTGTFFFFLIWVHTFVGYLQTHLGFERENTEILEAFKGSLQGYCWCIIHTIANKPVFISETQLFHLHHKFPFGHFEWSNYTEDSRKKDENMNTSKRVLGGGKWRTPLSWIWETQKT